MRTNTLAAPAWGKFLNCLFELKFYFLCYFFPASNPFTYCLNGGEEQNVNDSAYVTQNYWALPFFLKTTPWESYFQSEHISISTGASQEGTFPCSPIQRGSLLGFFTRPATLLSVLEENSIAVAPAEPINHDLEALAIVPSCLSLTKGNVCLFFLPVWQCSPHRMMIGRGRSKNWKLDIFLPWVKMWLWDCKCHYGDF